MPDFLPRADCNFLTFTANFAQKLSVDWELYHVEHAKAMEYFALWEEFARCYRAATEPGTRTVVSVREKNDVRARLKRATRSIATPMRANSAVSDEALERIGLHRPLKARRTFAEPSAAPKVCLQALGGRRIKVTLRDAERPSSKARPKDISHAIVFTRVGENVPENPNPWRFKMQAGEMDFEIEVEEFAPPGTRVWVSAGWLNRKCKRGPQSEPVSVRLTFDELIFPSQNAA